VFDNLIAFFDWHFNTKVSLSDDGAVHPMLKDYQVHSFLQTTHCLMYQACVLPNGMSLCWGPYLGKDHNAKTLLWTDILHHLENVAQKLYLCLWFMQVILKSPPGGQLLQIKHRYNALTWMQQFGIVIKNLFSEITTDWHTLQLATNKKIGKQDISRKFRLAGPCCVFLHNLHTILCRNLTSANVWPRPHRAGQSDGISLTGISAFEKISLLLQLSHQIGLGGTGRPAP
jgi:hypothetical protein